MEKLNKFQSFNKDSERVLCMHKCTHDKHKNTFVIQMPKILKAR